MFGVDKDTLKRLRNEFPVGCTVELVRMDDLRAPPYGTKGTVLHVDDIGTVHVKWANGSSLGAAYGDDIIRRIDK